MMGRLADTIVLSEPERRLLEAQLRRHKAARSLSDRCEMVLLCAEGLQSKDVTARPGLVLRRCGSSPRNSRSWQKGLGSHRP